MTILKRYFTGSMLAVSTVSLLSLPASALASASGAGSVKAQTDTANQAKLQVVIQRGNTEISRRLASLNTLSDKILSATKLSSSDNASLSSEVGNEISGLNSLKTTLDAETDVSAARTDAQSIINDYRVYALIVPKVALVKVADDQQVAEVKLAGLATKLTTHANTAPQKTQLADLNTKLQSAQSISSSIESSVAVLQPSDYNANHAVLSGDRDQLKAAQTDLKAAQADAQAIISSLKG